MNTASNKPSMLGSFLQGAGSGAFSGGIMAGIMSGLTLAAGLPFAATPMLLLVAGTGIFGGIMAVKRSMESASEAKALAATSRPSPVQEIAPTVALAPSIASPQMESAAEMETAAPTRSWVDRTEAHRPDRIREILDNGSMSDKDRASAILAAREANTAQGNSI